MTQYIGNVPESAKQEVIRVDQTQAHKNIIINSDYNINQRSYVNGTSVSSGTKMYDRWVCWSSNSNMSVSGIVCTLDHASGGTAGQIYQGIEAGQIIAGRQYTLSWKGTATITLWHNNGGTANFQSSPYTFTAGTDHNSLLWDYVIARGDGATISELKLEEGSTATIWEKPDVGEELIRAKRFTQVIFINAWTLLPMCVNDGTTAIHSAMYPLEVEMMVTPVLESVSATGNMYVRQLQDNVVKSTTASINTISWISTSKAISFYVTGGLTGMFNQGYFVQLRGTSCTLLLQAEL